MCTVTFTRFTAAGIMAIGMPGGGIRVAGINGAESTILSLLLADSPTPHDLQRALAEAAEEMDFHWPEFLPVERIKAGITAIILGFLLLAGIVAFCIEITHPN